MKLALATLSFALFATFVAGCTASEDPAEKTGPVAASPLQGTIEGTAFVAKSALAKKGFEEGEKSIDIYEGAVTCKDFAPKEKRKIIFSVPWKAGTARDFKFALGADGQTATFLDNVEAVLKNSRLTCEEMEVVLTERFSFRDDAVPAPAAEVQHVICKDGVQIDQKLFVNGDQSETRHGEFATLTIDQVSGRMDGVGPGKIDLWRPGRGKRAALAPRAVAQANRPLESEATSWEFTSVTFQGKTVGNLRDRQTKFQDRVHSIYGPVAHPLDIIDPDHLPKDGGDMECDTLQIIQRQGTASQKPYIELEAKGNAKLEGRAFNARADEITLVFAAYIAHHADQISIGQGEGIIKITATSRAA